MKIKLYKLQNVEPQNEKQLHKICELLDLPTLKYGTYISGNFERFINKKELKAGGFRIMHEYKFVVGMNLITGNLVIGADGMKYAIIN